MKFFLTLALSVMSLFIVSESASANTRLEDMQGKIFHPDQPYCSYHFEVNDDYLISTWIRNTTFPEWGCDRQSVCRGQNVIFKCVGNKCRQMEDWDKQRENGTTITLLKDGNIIETGGGLPPTKFFRSDETTYTTCY